MKKLLLIVVMLISLLFSCQDKRVRVKPTFRPLPQKTQEEIKRHKWRWIAIFLKNTYNLKESVEEIEAELIYQEYLLQQKK